MPKPFFITTAIDYVNGPPHVAHALEKTQADVVARFQRALGKDVFFLTGSDENSLKNVESAKKVGKPVQELVDENAAKFLALKEKLNLSFDAFIRTTEERHFAGAQKFWAAIKPEDLYKKQYEGLYCVGCEEFKMEKDLIDGKCPEHQTIPEKVEEENYFFQLSSYGPLLKEKIVSGEIRVLPEFRKNEILSFIDMGLADFSVSRSRERAQGWGVPVPEDESQIMYVWVDALANYITALDYATDGPLYRKFWAGEAERAHVIGKGILRFHAIYWPAMLLSAGLPLPTEIYAHEYLTINGQKISKSLGNAIDPDDLIARYGVDGTRYLLLSALPYTKDGDLSFEKMTEKYNADLANGLGNLVSRVMKLSESLSSSYVPEVPSDLPAEWKRLLEEYRLAEALQEIWKNVAEANKYMDETKPWVLVKQDKAKFETVMRKLLGDLAGLAAALRPFLPETSEKIEQALQTGKVVPLFQRLG